MELQAIKDLLAGYNLKNGATVAITTCPRYGSHTVTFRTAEGSLISRYPDYQSDFEFCVKQDLKFYGVAVEQVAEQVTETAPRLKMGLMRCDFATDRAYRVYKCAVKVYLIRNLWRFRADPKVRRDIRSHVIRLRDHRIGLLQAKKALDESAAKMAQEFLDSQKVNKPVILKCLNRAGEMVYLTILGYWTHNKNDAQVFTNAPEISDPNSFYGTPILFEDVI